MDVQSFQPTTHSYYNYLKLTITQSLQDFEWEVKWLLNESFNPPTQP